ncbi:hypothetical protein [Micromonospora sp. WMMD714]|uniref:hypothetical protein n=1 Tax=Micromonospora sp. WMMD714 TaxID=3016097 RepID=UPI00249B18BE|nr:hypothetical protein [Micromonospora sp. WMMD714]WFE63560.1 hypothetical protein O7625_09815 [Micromonospora sp. WMMD714]
MNAEQPRVVSDDQALTALSTVLATPGERAERVRAVVARFGAELHQVLWPRPTDPAHPDAVVAQLIESVLDWLAHQPTQALAGDAGVAGRAQPSEPVTRSPAGDDGNGDGSREPGSTGDPEGGGEAADGGAPGRVRDAGPPAGQDEATVAGAVPDGPAYEIGRLFDEFRADPAVAPWRDVPVPTDPAGRWQWMWLTCLALAPKEAARLRRRLRAATDPDNHPAPSADGLVPAAPRFDSAALPLPCTEPSPEVAEIAGGDRQLGCLVTDALTLADSVAGLAHSLNVTGRRPMPRLDEPGQRTHYRAALLRQLSQYVNQASTDPAGRLRWLVNVDEAVRSIFPCPPPEPDSWWRTEFARRCTDLVRERFDAYAGRAVLHVPDHGYPALWNGDVATETDIEVVPGGVDSAKQVRWVLRVAHQIDEFDGRGRVIYSR